MTIYVAYHWSLFIALAIGGVIGFIIGCIASGFGKVNNGKE